MKNLTVKIKDERHADLLYIKNFINENSYTEFNQTQIIEHLLYSVANAIRNTGDLQFRTKEELRTEKIASDIKYGIKY